MRVKREDQCQVVIFLPKTDLTTLDFTSKDQLEDYFKMLFLKLEDRYDNDMSGFYQIMVYQDPYYGAIFEIEQDDIPYLDYFDHQVEMSIHIAQDSFFLYQIEDVLALEKTFLRDLECYQYQGQFFVRLKEKMIPADYMRLLEHSQIVYGKKVHTIIKFGRVVEHSLCQ